MFSNTVSRKFEANFTFKNENIDFHLVELMDNVRLVYVRLLLIN